MQRKQIIHISLNHPRFCMNGNTQLAIDLTAKFFEKLIDRGYIQCVACGMHAHTYQFNVRFQPVLLFPRFTSTIVFTCAHIENASNHTATTAIIPLRGVYRFCLANLDKDRGKIWSNSSSISKADSTSSDTSIDALVPACSDPI